MRRVCRLNTHHRSTLAASSQQFHATTDIEAEVCVESAAAQPFRTDARFWRARALAEGEFRRFWLICAKPRNRINFCASARKYFFWHFERKKQGFAQQNPGFVQHNPGFAQPARRLSAIQSDFRGLEAKTRRFLMARARIIFRVKPRKTGIPALSFGGLVRGLGSLLYAVLCACARSLGLARRSLKHLKKYHHFLTCSGASELGGGAAQTKDRTRRPPAVPGGSGGVHGT